ncbi:MAG TPA: MFS transporter [Candidatus Hydrogenedentes bacterium]|nr:MFS transporter [Candidatus Hydrogenedentota bacterium]
MKPISTKKALALCYGGMICIAVAANLTPLFLTTFSELFLLNEEQLGRIAAIIFAGFVVGIIITGPLADRLGAKPFVLLGLAFTAAGLALLGAAINYPLLLAAAALMGLGAGLLDMVLSPIVSALQPDRRASAMNWLHSFYCIGALITVLVGALALRLQWSWRPVSFAIILLPAFLILGFARLRIPPLVHEDNEREPVVALLRRPFFIAALMLILLAGATENGMSQWLPAYAERVLNFGKASSGMALAGFSICMALGRILAASAAHHVPPRALLSACGLLSAIMYLTGCFAPWPPVALTACMLVGFTGGCLWPTTLAVTADRIPHGGASMFGMLAASGNAGCLILPWLIGFLAEHSTLQYALAAGTLCPLLISLLPLLMPPKH